MFHTSAEETYQDGQIIFGEGSSGDWIYVVISGAVELSKLVEGQKVVIETVQAGEVFGEVAFIAGTPRTATATAVGTTTVGIMDRGFLDEEFNKLSADFRIILSTLAMRLKKTTDVAIGKRKDPAMPKVLTVTFKDRESFLQAYSNTPAGEGIFIRTPSPLSRGDRFFLKLQIPDSPQPLRIGCEVTSSTTATDDPVGRPVGMGVAFRQIPGGDEERLRKLIGPAGPGRTG